MGFICRTDRKMIAEYERKTAPLSVYRRRKMLPVDVFDTFGNCQTDSLLSQEMAEPEALCSVDVSLSFPPHTNRYPDIRAIYMFYY